MPHVKHLEQRSHNHPTTTLCLFVNMAPSRKRSRGDGDDEGAQSAASSFRQDAKRSRVAMAQERGGSTVSDDESEGDLERMMNGTDDEEENDQPMAQPQ